MHGVEAPERAWGRERGSARLHDDPTSGDLVRFRLPRRGPVGQWLCFDAPNARERVMDVVINPFRGVGLPADAPVARGEVVADPSGARALLGHCPVASTTPLRDVPALPGVLGIGSLWLKDERDRLGLGSFKALGAGHAIARLAVDRLGPDADLADERRVRTALAGTVFTCASAGNHGLAVTAAARVFGARAVVHVHAGVPASFLARLRARGATVVVSGGDYDASMAIAAESAREQGHVLLSDSSWPGYVDLPRRVMEGYLVLAAEIAEVVSAPPTHVVLQAGVGGLAAAVTAFVRATWGDAPRVVVVEPGAAPALQASIRAGAPVRADGAPSTMGRLDCKVPSHLALASLARDADAFATITDDECAATVELLGEQGLATTPSGAAGVSALHHATAHRDLLALSTSTRALAVLTEAAP